MSRMATASHASGGEPIFPGMAKGAIIALLVAEFIPIIYRFDYTWFVLSGSSVIGMVDDGMGGMSLWSLLNPLFLVTGVFKVSAYAVLLFLGTTRWPPLIVLLVLAFVSSVVGLIELIMVNLDYAWGPEYLLQRAVYLFFQMFVGVYFGLVLMMARRYLFGLLALLAGVFSLGLAATNVVLWFDPYGGSFISDVVSFFSHVFAWLGILSMTTVLVACIFLRARPAPPRRRLNGVGHVNEVSNG